MLISKTDFKPLGAMQPIKIKSISIKGLRGIKNQLTIPLDGKSVVFYGDNGSGKSSIVDSIEWYYKDRVEHLASEEIGRDALRHVSLNNDEAASIEVKYSSTNLDNAKSLAIQKGKLSSSFSNTSDESQKYLTNSENENILLRYQNLRDFINTTKGEKLRKLSEIIGFSEVTKTKEILKKSFNSINSEIKTKGFESQIQTQQKTLLGKVGANINTEEQLFKILNEVVKPLQLGVTISEMKDIDTILEKIKKPTDNKKVAEVAFLQKCNQTINTLKSDLTVLYGEYDKYYKEFEQMFSDVESIKQTLLSKVLEAGKNILSNKLYEQENCPLCLHPQSKTELTKTVEERLKEITQSSKKLENFQKIQGNAKNFADERIRRIDSLLSENLINQSENSTIKNCVSDIKAKLSNYSTEATAKLLSGNMIKKSEDLKLDDKLFSFTSDIDGIIKSISSELEKNISADIRVKVEFAKDSFETIQRLKVEKETLEKQKTSLENIYNEFVKKQKDGLEAFLTSFSSQINEYYQFMNPYEQFEDLKIVGIQDEDELKGITIEFKFNGSEVSPPQKYFSESHLNCYGISFFLASVKAFNKLNKFLVLDDVISSFDSNHRKKFADLLFEKFSDYQLIVLTHEDDWFAYFKELAKRKSWHIHKIKWSDANGTYLDSTPSELKALIEHQIANSIESQLGNSIRMYLEHSLKSICAHLEVKVNFKFNDQNEKRMSDEMLNELKSKLSKSSELTALKATIERVANSNILGNLLSHDNAIEPKIGDLKAFWSDVIAFEKLFYCQEETCGKNLSLINYDSVEKKVRCGCGTLKYDWKK